jgi:glucosamine-6-phosphate deaminase
VQQLKGRVREWESDLKWAYYGFSGEAVRHLRLGFYKGDIFTEIPTVEPRRAADPRPGRR